MTISDLTDLSSPEPVVKWSEAWWENAKPEVRAHRCKAHRKNGDRCKRATIDGANVCPQHGGRAPQVHAKAQRRLAEATDTMVRALLKMPTDDNVADAVKLTAIRDALDRGGVVAKTAVEVNNSLAQFSASPDLQTEFVFAVIGAMESHTDLSTQILNNPEISQKLMGELVPIIYKALQATA